MSGIALLSYLFLHLRQGGKFHFYSGIAAVNFFASAILFFDRAALVFGDISDLDQERLMRFFIALLWVSCAYLLDAWIKTFVYPKRLTTDGDTKVPLLLQHIISVVIYLSIAMIVMRYVYHQPITTVAATSGAVALALGYSARSLLDEFFAGLALNLSVPFEKDELVQINDEWGYIRDITWRSISYLDMNQNIVVVPNTIVANSKILNLDRPSKMCRRTFEFRVEYNIPPNVVIEEAEAAMKECPHVMDHPWNFVGFLGFDEKGMRYKSHFHIEHYDHWYTGIDEVVNSMWYRFSRKGIRFAHQRHLNFTSEIDEKRPLPGSAYNEENWRDLTERFTQVPMFEGVTRADMEELAKCATLHIVGPPERIIRAGSKHTSMFMIATGSADVYEVDENGRETLMASAGPSETLGLMSVLTGDPQRTTIRAREESAVWEISSESLHQLFERKPDVMKNIAESITQWQAEEDEAIKALAMSRQQESGYIKKRTNFLVNRISRFFHKSKEDESSLDYTDY